MAEKSGRVITTASVLLTAHTILPAGAELHTIYISPAHQLPDPHIQEVIKKDYRREAAYTRKPYGTKNISSAQYQYEKTLNALRTQRWKKLQLFQLALANLAHKPMRLVYSPTQNSQPSESEIAPPDGLLIAEKNKTLIVLAVQKASRVSLAGIAAKDQLLTLNGQPLHTLEDFSNAWKGTQDKNSYTIKKPTGKILSLTLTPPATLKSSILDLP